jgi:hypothetical protein
MNIFTARIFCVSFNFERHTARAHHLFSVPERVFESIDEVVHPLLMFVSLDCPIVRAPELVLHLVVYHSTIAFVHGKLHPFQLELGGLSEAGRPSIREQTPASGSRPGVSSFRSPSSSNLSPPDLYLPKA